MASFVYLIFNFILSFHNLNFDGYMSSADSLEKGFSLFQFETYLEICYRSIKESVVHVVFFNGTKTLQSGKSSDFAVKLEIRV